MSILSIIIVYYIGMVCYVHIVYYYCILYIQYVYIVYYLRLYCILLYRGGVLCLLLLYIIAGCLCSVHCGSDWEDGGFWKDLCPISLLCGSVDSRYFIGKRVTHSCNQLRILRKESLAALSPMEAVFIRKRQLRHTWEGVEDRQRLWWCCLKPGKHRQTPLRTCMGSMTFQGCHIQVLVSRAEREDRTVCCLV